MSEMTISCTQTVETDMSKKPKPKKEKNKATVKKLETDSSEANISQNPK